MDKPKKTVRKRPRRTFTPEFKAEAVRLCKVGDRSIRQVAEDLDLTETALREWVHRAAIDAGKGPAGALTTEERAELARLRPGLAASVTPAGGTPVAGRVRMVAPTVDAATRNGLVYVDLPQPGAARAGMFARGEFALGEAQGLSLPQAAVLLRDGFSYVMAVGPDGRVRQLKVATGRRWADRVEVTGGLPPATRVVASGGAFLADGDTVRVVDAAPAAR